ncbi:hypothetical protein BB558_003049 [Smittium angustum]|uniref:Arginine repressor DNA-binding domain-containing protein n=1 Tax=Smittium angustum TaxID=133377 RepID=A0A2U1J702_SMIAN|nr:hypothetical protein BB558_003049 [Smittium angustum]
MGITPLDNCILEIVNSDNSLTQEGIIKKLAEKGFPGVKQPTVSRRLKKLGITRKRLTLIKDQAITQENMLQKRAYSNEIFNTKYNRLLYLDETGFNLHSSNDYGYSLKGTCQKDSSYPKGKKCIRFGSDFRKWNPPL